MEKFGIFELLDTLSALTLPQTDETQPKNGEGKQAPASVKANPNDAAFAPPVFAFPQTQSGEGASPAAEQPDGNALSSLLDRHDSISKKIDGKKPQ